MRKLITAPLLGMLLLTGCASGNKGLYYWGSYEPVLLDAYTNPGEAPTEVQIEKLTATIARAQDNHMNVPPGVFAHLGMLYARQGSTKLAIEALTEEKKRFPESAVFIDGLLARADKEKAQ